MSSHNIETGKYLKLFSCCIPVKGVVRSVICDLQRGRFDFIPNDLHEMLTMFDGKLIADIVTQYGDENEYIIIEYISFLLENEYAFYCDSETEVAAFPAIALTYYSPRSINNAIIEFSEVTAPYIPDIITELDKLLCKDVELRFYNSTTIENLESIIGHFNNTTIQTIQVLIRYADTITRTELLRLAHTYYRLYAITVFASPEVSAIKRDRNLDFRLIYITDNIDSSTHCGIIHPAYFAINTDTFAEAQHFNTCLNKKISVDTDGNIKNCPSMRQAFGQIGDTSLTEAMQKEGFTDKWAIRKDVIEVCRECEFRYICTDCRAYQDSAKEDGKPVKCTYDPYTGKWS